MKAKEYFVTKIVIDENGERRFENIGSEFGKSKTQTWINDLQREAVKAARAAAGAGPVMVPSFECPKFMATSPDAMTVLSPN